jgi:DedD protein
MENRLKERLTGAAILVALIVMLVPEMFHGQRGDVGAIAGSSGEGPPLRSYTIDLSNGPTRAGPLQSTPPAAGSSGGNDDKTSPVPVPAQPSAVTAARPAAAAAATAAPVAAAPALADSRSPAPAPSHTTPQAGWGVQLGLFAKRENAERLMRSAQAKGFAVSVSNADVKGLYRVYAGGMADRAAAEAYSHRLKEHGLAAAVVAPP